MSNERNQEGKLKSYNSEIENKKFSLNSNVPQAESTFSRTDQRNIGMNMNIMNNNPSSINILPEEIIMEKSKKWRQHNTKRFADKKKFGFVEGQKDKLPCEVLRYV
jgi:hypothetical protein